MVTHNLFACNTALKKRAKDTTSWKSTCAAKGWPNGSKDTVEFYRQIDYIYCVALVLRSVVFMPSPFRS